MEEIEDIKFEEISSEETLEKLEAFKEGLKNLFQEHKIDFLNWDRKDENGEYEGTDIYVKLDGTPCFMYTFIDVVENALLEAYES